METFELRQVRVKIEVIDAAQQVKTIDCALGFDRGRGSVALRRGMQPEAVLHAYASARQISSSMRLITMIAELRKAKELATPYVTIPAGDQRDFVDDARRKRAPGAPRHPD